MSRRLRSKLKPYSGLGLVCAVFLSDPATRFDVEVQGCGG
jgi:hypothetical protein